MNSSSPMGRKGRFDPGANQPVSLGDGLRQAIRQLGLSPAFRAHRVLVLWPKAAEEVVGAEAAKGSQALRLQDGALVVAVSGDAWRHRLLMEREVLRAKLNEWMGSDIVDSLRFVKQAGPASA